MCIAHEPPSVIVLVVLVFFLLSIFLGTLPAKPITSTTESIQVRRLCMDDAPVPYASSMEKAVVKRGEDLIEAVLDLAKNA